DGLTQPYRPPDADTFADGWSDPDDHFHGRDGSALALLVNTDIAPNIPSDWEDLAGDEWAGLVTMPDPRESGTARDFVAALVDDAGEDEAFALFDELIENGMSVEGPNRPALDSVVSGTHAAVIGGV